MAINLVQLGKRVSEIRKQRGLSQTKLSELIQKSPTYISYIECGLKSMSLDTFVAIANELHVSADELLADSLENNIVVSNHAFAALIADCSEFEKRVLLASAGALKAALREHQHLIYRYFR